MLRDVENDLFDDFEDEDPDFDEEDFEEGGWATCTDDEEE